MKYFLIALLFTSCGKATVRQKEPTPYERLRAKVLEPYCLKCHSIATPRKPDLTTEANVVAVKAEIQAEVLEKRTMPPREVLREEEFEVVREWLK